MSLHKTILSQIGGLTLGAIGASEFVAVSEDTLRMRVRISNQRNYIYITLNGRDLYDLRQTLVRGGKEVTKYTAGDIYCDELSEVVYRLGSTRHVRPGWLESVGIKAAA